MAKYYDTDTVYEQPTPEEIRTRANLTQERSSAKGKPLEPVVVKTHGENVASSWWGRAWCDNLERYADYENRIERGKNYVRSGAVVDLKIAKGKVTARVQGMRSIPYKVEIRISPLSEEKCQEVIKLCEDRIESVEELLSGNFPEELQDLFTNTGLFPEPTEISFSCSCPDWALMCKHVAAALYAIGVRLDDDPLLLFKLRGIDPERIADAAVDSRIERMLKNADQISSRVIGSKWSEMFGL